MALATFHGLSVGGGRWGAHTHTCVHTHFCWGPCLPWPRNVHTGSQVPACGPALLSGLCPPLKGSRSIPARLPRTVSLQETTSDITLAEQVSHLCICSSPREYFPCSTNFKICVLGFEHCCHQAPCAACGDPVASASTFIRRSAGHAELTECCLSSVSFLLGVLEENVRPCSLWPLKPRSCVTSVFLVQKQPRGVPGCEFL